MTGFVKNMTSSVIGVRTLLLCLAFMVYSLAFGVFAIMKGADLFGVSAVIVSTATGVFGLRWGKAMERKAEGGGGTRQRVTS
ncbi:MAG: hypothetical protein V3S82_05255 [Dehalococcoidia bacterium]